MMKFIVFLSLLMGTLACTYYDHSFPYDFENPTSTTRLEKQLKEISGLHYKDENTLYAVQDEVGKVFEVNLTTGKAKAIINFRKEGDFEGLTKKGEFFYALKSNGSIYEIDKEGEVNKFTFVSDAKGFEFEGLCLDRTGDNLLVACKQHGKKKKDDHIWVYQFSLKEKKYKDKEFLKILKEDVHKKFRPSGISMDEQGTLYLIAANTFTIASFNSKGILLNKAQLPYLSFPQVEGICFAPNGVLYLSSEKGDQDKGKIITLKKNAK